MIPRTLRYGALLAAAALLVTACGSTAGGGGDAAGGSVESGGTAIFVDGADPKQLNPAISTDPQVIRPGLAMFEGLTWSDSNLEIHPELAESWEISDDGTVYTFHLRQNATWHDGTPFTADDVVYNLQDVLPLRPTGKVAASRLSAAEAVDPHTVRVTLTEPFAPLLLALSDDSAPLIPAHVYRGTDVLTNPANLTPVGTGPFAFQAYTPGSIVELVRNENYWAGPVPLDKIIFSIIPDANARLLAFQSDEADYLFGSFVDTSKVAQFRATPGAVVGEGRNAPAVFGVEFNVTRAPLDNPVVRQAIAVAIDRELIVRSAFDGEATPSKSAFPIGITGSDNDVDYDTQYAYDPDRARMMLADAACPV
ncbi:hypothetical protein BJF78_19430 [Pseudonocardia sp. CNS-139]|nr:hypothetical protein BJF78_19430 [Pseudonocardia sp. CNS-139]